MAIKIESVQNLVRETARQELLPRFANVAYGYKLDGSLITEVDLAMQKCLAVQLARKWPDVTFLGEEMPETEQAAILNSGTPLWCLDPLDGTRNFAAGIPFFCVSLALLEDHRISLGIVYDPLRDECFAAQKNQGATLNGRALNVTKSGLALQQATALIDFKRLPKPLASRLATEPPYASQRSFGSIALDWCWLAAGRCQLYLHGKQNIWDYAAGSLVFAEAGGHALTLEGDEIFVHALVSRSAVAAGETGLFESWIRWLGVTRT